jgi:aminoglycoside phosphotransferase (APT) family kinase protein
MYIDGETSSMTSVAKLPRRTWDVTGITVEAAALSMLNNASAALSGQVPLVHEIEHGPRPYLLESALVGAAAGPDLVRKQTALVVDSGFDLVRQLARLARPPRASDWYSRLIDEPLRRFSESVPLGSSGGELVSRTRTLLNSLKEADLPLVAAHGDLGHPNLILTAEGRMGAIDWERFEAQDLPARDLVFFLQYVCECRNSAITISAQRQAFDEAFVGSQAWAGRWLTKYADELGFDYSLLPGLILAAWARTSTGLVTRLTPSVQASPSTPTMQSALAEAFQRDRDFALWQHAVTRYSVLLR